jgi:hypothetical protein
MGLLKLDPLDERPDVVAEVERVTRRLHSGEAAGLAARRHGCILAHARGLAESFPAFGEQLKTPNPADAPVPRFTKVAPEEG